MEQTGGSLSEERIDGITVVHGKWSGSVLFMAAESISGGIRKGGGVLRRDPSVFSSTDSEQQSGFQWLKTKNGVKALTPQ